MTNSTNPDTIEITVKFDRKNGRDKEALEWIEKCMKYHRYKNEQDAIKTGIQMTARLEDTILTKEDWKYPF